MSIHPIIMTLESMRKENVSANVLRLERLQLSMLLN